MAPVNWAGRGRAIWGVSHFFRRAEKRPMLKGCGRSGGAMGNVIHVGDVGAGLRLKLVTNQLWFIHGGRGWRVAHRRGAPKRESIWNGTLGSNEVRAADSFVCRPTIYVDIRGTVRSIIHLIYVGEGSGVNPPS